MPRGTERLRAAVPADLPPFVRISSSDWSAGWAIQQLVALSKWSKGLGVDSIGVSSGGNLPAARIPAARCYQVPCSRRIRDEAEILAGAIGQIADTKAADDILTGGDADHVLVGRELLHERYGR